MQKPNCIKLILSAAMLATQLNTKVADGSIDTHCVIRLDKYVCNPIQDRYLTYPISI